MVWGFILSSSRDFVPVARLVSGLLTKGGIRFGHRKSLEHQFRRWVGTHLARLEAEGLSDAAPA